MAIDYTRRDRPRRNRPFTAQATVEDPDTGLEGCPSESASNRDPIDQDTRSSGTDDVIPLSLSAATAQLEDLRRTSWRPAALASIEQANDALLAFLHTHPDIQGTVTQLRAAHQSLRQAMLARYPDARHEFEPDRNSHGEGRFRDVAHWLDAANNLDNDARTVRVPFTAKARLSDRISFINRWRALDAALPDVVRALRHQAFDTMVGRGESEALRAAEAARARAATVFLPPPPVGPFTQPCDRVPFASEHGPLEIVVGVVSPRKLLFRAVSAGEDTGDRTGQDVSIEYPSGIEIPVVIDLETHGGIVTNSPPVVERLVLQLMAALPARQLVVSAFDPRGLGDSVKFLFGLGDVASRIIGEKVKTTERELDVLLQESEEHIAFVNQRFLQGEYDTLTAYNEAAGDVAEPYRILLLFGFPHGFTRGGSQDFAERLDKIIMSGPRAGVFTVIVGDGPDLDAPPLRSDRLPRLLAGLEVATSELSKVLPWMGDTVSGLTQRPQSAFHHSSGAFLRSHSERATGSTDVEHCWFFLHLGPLDVAIAESLLRRVVGNALSANDVQVSPGRVAELQRAAERRQEETLGRPARDVADPRDRSTWWGATSVDGVSVPFGRLGARNIAELRFDDSSFGALVGGRPGSGKSVLLHAVIMGLALRYDPRELELYLLDFKEGVEFKQYASFRLPHARVVAIESEREFGVAVLESLDAEMRRRGELFRAAGAAGEQNLAAYRRATGAALARCVLIVDEFQQLFEKPDRLATRASELLESLVRRGRAFGVHVMLASQTLSGMDALPKHILRLIPTRIALQSNEADSRLLLAEDNPDAQLLTRAGEGILNLKQGMQEANQRFQAAYWSAEDRASALGVLHTLARPGGSGGPVVFEGQAAASVDDHVSREGAADAIPIGLPMTLDGPVHAALRREPGGNVLIVEEDPGLLATGVAVTAAGGALVHVLDHVGVHDQWAEVAEAFRGSGTVRVHSRRQTVGLLNELDTLVQKLHADEDYRGPTVVLAIAGLHRAREFDADSYDDDAPSNVLARILRDGPEVGIHTIVWLDKATSLRRKLSNPAQSDLGLRVVGRCSSADSHALVDSEAAAGLKASQAIFDDHDRSIQVTVRRFAMPSSAWVADLLNGRQA